MFRTLGRFIGVCFLSALVLGLSTSSTALAGNGKRKGKATQLVKAFKKKGLKAIPDSSDALAKKKSKKRSKKSKKNRVKNNSFGLQAVSGNPPEIVSIPDLDLESLFWQSGDLEAIANHQASADQCERFWKGMGACQMVENVGYSFSEMLSANTSLCYMKNAPSKKNLDAGGISVVSGELPGGNVDKLFVPSKEARIVHVVTTGDQGHGEEEESGDEDIFIRIPSFDELKENKEAYSTRLWFCNGTTPVGYNNISIGKDGLIESVSADKGHGGGSELFISTVTGYITTQDASGKRVSWDTSKAREASTEFKQLAGDLATFKSSIRIFGDTLITKSVDTWGGEGARNTYNYSQFAGSGFDNVALKAGAFIGSGEFGDYEAATEYQSTGYVDTPNSSLARKVRNFSFSEDSFFSSVANPEIDLSGFDCQPDVSVTVLMDMSNPTLQEAVGDCEPPHGDMHFCFGDEAIRAAEQGFDAACNQQH